MESFYQFHIQYTTKDKNKDERKSLKRGRYFPFMMRQISPDRADQHNVSYMTLPSSKFSPR